MSYAHGIDVSNWQGTIIWDVLNQNLDLSFVYALESDGNFTGKVGAAPISIVSAYERNKRLCKKPFGAYHYARPASTSPFVVSERCAESSVGNSLPAMLDVESHAALEAMPIESLVQWVGHWITNYESVDGRVPILYGSAYLKTIGIFRYFPNVPRWFAAYPNNNVDPNPEYLTRPNLNGNPMWDIWQYTDRGRLTGITGYVDKNITTFPFLNQLLSDSNSYGSEDIMPSFIGIEGEAGQYILTAGMKVGVHTQEERALYVQAGVVADHTIWYSDPKMVETIRALPDGPIVPPAITIDSGKLASDIVRQIGSDLLT